jgi:DNA topoisomerase I
MFSEDELIKKCPHCGKNLTIREGKYGMFYGCSGFPRCAYTEKKKEGKNNLEKMADKILLANGRKDLIIN